MYCDIISILIYTSREIFPNHRMALAIYRELCLNGTDWGEEVKPLRLEKWSHFAQNLNEISWMQLPQWLNNSTYSTISAKFVKRHKCKNICAYSKRYRETTHLLVAKAKVDSLQTLSLHDVSSMVHYH